jgi:diguanylate cyclase (GGDEF)-like protein/PAS domain S-box-containing protein
LRNVFSSLRFADRMSQPDDFSTLFELLPIGAYRMGADGEMLRANAALVALNGAKDEAELRTYSNENWYAQPGRRAEFLALLRANDSVSGFVSEVVEEKTGVRRWVTENAHIVRDHKGEVLYYEGTAEDITYIKNVERDLQLSVRRFAALTAKSQSATIVCDTEGNIGFASEAVRLLFGLAPEEMVGSNVFDSMHPEDQAAHRLEFARVTTGENSGEESVARHLHADGTWRYLASFAKDARDDEAVRGMIVYWRDVTEAHLARQRLQQIAESDSLTGLSSRAHFERSAVAMLEAHREQATPIALYFIDLDNFKFANDSYGHWIGDQVLIVVARRLQMLCTPHDLLARIGGDEFAVLSLLSNDASAATLFAQRIITAIAEPIQIESVRFELTASVGVAVFPKQATRFTELLRYADQAMFAAKGESRNTYLVFAPALEQRARAQAALIADLKRALPANEFTVYYQPQIDMSNGSLVGVEALVRWRHPERGIVLPHEFISVAEEQGLINRIGLAVIDQAVGQIAAWRQRAGRPLRLAINVSARQLRDRSLGERLGALLAHHDLPADAIEVEVTESILVEASAAGRDLLHELRKLGVRIVLDDLGVGYSSMSYLRQFPVDGVKLDRSFVEGLPTNAVDTAIVRSIIGMANELELTLVAEGIERTEQRDYLLAERCRVGQGYLFAEPLSPQDFESSGWLKRAY